MRPDVKLFIVTTRAKPFTGQPREEHKFFVELDGKVRVWDDVAGYFTAVHSLSESAQKRIRNLAHKQYPDFYAS